MSAEYESKVGDMNIGRWREKMVRERLGTKVCGPYESFYVGSFVSMRMVVGGPFLVSCDDFQFTSLCVL